MSQKDALETYNRPKTPADTSNSQRIFKSSNKARFRLLALLVLTSIVIAISLHTENGFNTSVIFATWTTLAYASVDAFLYLSEDSSQKTTQYKHAVKQDKKISLRALKVRSSISKAKHWVTQNKIIVVTIIFLISFIAAMRHELIIKVAKTLFKYFSTEAVPLSFSLSVTLLVIILMFSRSITELSQKYISNLTNKYFIFTLAGLAILGASSALLIPSYTNWFRAPKSISTQQETLKEHQKPQAQSTPTLSPSDNKATEVEQKTTSDLRLHLLYITGGIIAILGLIETNRKNSQDHIRQVHAARRDRYIEAVDKLSSDSAPVRLGGVYALAGLVDEWLEDDNIDEKNRITEGQVIINNLCSYIRSPFPIAENIDKYEARKELEALKKQSGKTYDAPFKALLERLEGSVEYEGPTDITADYAKFHEEQDVRRAIFVEMSKRSSTFIKDKKGNVIKTNPGIWSDFDFDFSRAPIFYPLNNLTIEQGQFSAARFYGNTDFTFAKFTRDANFGDAMFTGYANFWGAEFTGDAYFWGTEFTRIAAFWNAEFTGNAEFKETKFISRTRFNNAKFAGKTSFKGAYFKKYVPTFADDIGSARFSSQRDQKDYVFSADQNGKPINCGTATLDGKSLEIPLGAVLFNPSSGETSESAKAS